MPVPYPEKERYTVDDLVKIVAILRSPEGCPWDKVQTHESIRSNMLEEAYEAIEAINQQDTAHLKEELGDVLLQVAFHSQMEAERSTFSFEDVADGVCRKMLTRHPHVFGELTAADPTQALKTWDAVKRQTAGDKKQSHLLDSVPRALPALMRSEKVQNRAARVGYDHADVAAALAELDAAREGLTGENGEQALGRLLLAASAVARLNKWDAEQALTDETDAFIARFKEWEQTGK